MHKRRIRIRISRSSKLSKTREQARYTRYVYKDALNLSLTVT
jgi:hypothetical protein